jgi:hypothetical protein
MAISTMNLLERLYGMKQVWPQTITFGRQLVGNNEDLKKEAWRKCAAADAILQGDCTTGAAQFVDLGIRTSKDLWNYRQFMAEISGYKSIKQNHAWTESDTYDENRNSQLVSELRLAAPANMKISGVIVRPQSPPGPAEVCREIDFGFDRVAKSAPAPLTFIIELILLEDPNAGRILRDEIAEAERTRDREYADFLKNKYCQCIAP